MGGGRNLLWFIPLVLLLGWPLYGGVLREFLAPPELGHAALRAGASPGRRFVMEGVRLYQDLAGERQWRIETPTLRTGPAGDELLLAAVEAVLFREGREHLFIVAGRGRYDSVGEILYLDDQVQLREEAGFILVTPSLSYHEGQRRVRGRAGVEINTPELRVRGREFDYDLVGGRYLLSGDVRFNVR